VAIDGHLSMTVFKDGRCHLSVSISHELAESPTCAEGCDSVDIDLAVALADETVRP
jgi:hypothetical protein